MTEPVYETIWRDWTAFLPERLDGNECIMMLDANYRARSKKQQALLFETMLQIVLTQGKMNQIALGVIEDKMNIEHRRQIHGLVKKKLISFRRLVDSEKGKATYTPAFVYEEEGYLNMLVNVLSFEKTDEFIETLNYFYLERPVGRIPSRPSDHLFFTHPDIYVKAWTRIFSTQPYDEWRSSGLTQGFLDSPEKILTLKGYMIVCAPATWLKFKNALLEWLDREYIGRIKLEWPSKQQKENARKAILS